MNIVQVDYETEIGMFHDAVTDGFKYFFDHEKPTVREVAEYLVDFYEYSGLKEDVTLESVVLNFIKSEGAEEWAWVIEELNSQFFDEGEYEWETFEDLMEDRLVYEVMEYIQGEFENGHYTEGLSFFVQANGFVGGTVGHSEWAFVIHHEDISYQYVADYFEGYNFFVISLMTEDGAEEHVSDIYAPTFEELDDAIRGHLVGDEEYYLVKNDVTKYFDDAKFVELVPTTTYEFRKL